MSKLIRASTLFLIPLLLVGCSPKTPLLVPHEVALPDTSILDDVLSPIPLRGLPKTYGEYLIDSYYMRAVTHEYEVRLDELRQLFDSLKCIPDSEY